MSELPPAYPICLTPWGAQALANDMNRSEPKTQFPWIVVQAGQYWTVVRQKPNAGTATVMDVES